MAAGLSVDLDGWRREFDELMLRVGGRFARVEPRRRMAAFVRGLLAGLPRVNCWPVAEHAGEQCPRGMQRLLSAAVWDNAGMRDDLRGYVLEHFADPGAVLVVDLCRSRNYAEVPAACGECCWPWASEWGVRGRRAGIVR